jgi:hypothetical protein
MPQAVQTAGVTTVFVKIAADTSAPLTLGQTRNYAEVTHEAFFLDVPGDANGGDDGPPIEVQYLGEISRVRCELTKWDKTTADVVRRRSKAQTTAGTPGTAGTLMFGGTNVMRLLLNNANDVRNFNRAIPRMPIEIGRGTKYSTLVCEFECHKDSNGVLYNADAADATKPDGVA